MKKSGTIYLLTLLAFTFSLLTPSLLKAQLNITPNQTALALAQQLAGQGVQVSNATLTCAGEANGIFTKVVSNLPIDSGIILTTGQAATAGTVVGANAPYIDWANTSHSGPADPDLATILGTTPSNDACVLEFDFIPAGDTVKFEYIFASDEYDGPHGNYNCSIFDVFGFFISGPGISGPFTNNAVNIALVPGTTNVYVGVSTVNNGNGAFPGNSCYTNTNGVGPYTQYYNDNVGSTTLAYSGYTDIFTAVATVTPCVSHHLKLAISDASDFSWDSGVFLKAGSLTSPSASISRQYPGPNGLDSTGLNYALRGCLPGEFIFRRPVAAPLPLVVKYLIQGTAINGVDYQMIPDSVIIPANQTSASVLIQGLPPVAPTGPVTVKLVVLSYACSGSAQTRIDSAELNLYEAFVAEILNEDTIVCQDVTMQLRAQADSLLEFAWTPANAVDDPTKINPTAQIRETTTFTISATFPGSGCPPTQKSFTAFVEPVEVTVMPDTALCLSDPLQIRTDIKAASPPDISYLWFPTSNLDDPFAKEPMFWVEGAGEYTYVVAAQTPKGCTSLDTITIVTRPAVHLTNVTEDFTAKYGQEVQLNAEATNVEYWAWTPADLLDYPHTQDPKATGIDPTTFMVIGMNYWGCKDTAYVKMGIDYSMLETIPNAFSPNNDGRNDVFRIGQMKYQRLLEFRIFSRWGTEVYSSTDPNKGWDGTYKGEPQEVGVYHYIVRVATPDGKTRSFKGDVTLVR